MFQQLEQDPGPAASALKTSIFRLGCVQAVTIGMTSREQIDQNVALVNAIQSGVPVG